MVRIRATTGDVMSLKTFVVAQALLAALKTDQVQDVVTRIAFEVDKILDDNGGKRSEMIQAKIVSELLLPLCYELTCETKEGRLAYREAIAKAFVRADQALK